MISVENVNVWGFEHAIRGMRNPYESWSKSDSHSLNTQMDKPTGLSTDYGSIMFGPSLKDYYLQKAAFEIGPNDLRLAKSLFKGGTEHRKYLRQIFVSLDITAPLYWWKEFDTYKIGTVANSSSTMHLIASRPFTLDDFSVEHLGYFDPELDWNAPQPYEGTIEDLGNGPYYPIDLMEDIIDMLNHNRKMYLETKDKLYWWQLIQLLPSSYNQRRTVTMNYENIAAIIHQRSGHKLDEWRGLIDILKRFPYVSEIMLED